MAGDSTWSNNSLLLLGDGADGSTTFLDRSPLAQSMTVNSGASISTTSPKYGTGSMSFNGSSGNSTTPNQTSAFALGANAFWTIDFWLKSTTTNGSVSVMVNYNQNATGAWSFQHNAGTVGRLQVTGPGASPGDNMYNIFGTTLFDGVWNHVALTGYQSNKAQLWLKGAVQGEIGTTNAWGAASSGILLGAKMFGGSLSGYFTGNLFGVRIKKGTAMWSGTSNITPPDSYASYLPPAGAALFFLAMN